MNKEAKAMWLEWLRTPGRETTFGRLRDVAGASVLTDRICPLGGLTVCAIEAGEFPNPGIKVWSRHTHPDPVAKWAALSNEKENGVGSEMPALTIIKMNDGVLSFVQIKEGDWVEIREGNQPMTVIADWVDKYL